MKETKRRGFTLVEVALFLAVTGMLFVGIVFAIQNSMFQQRYNDSVQSFAEFLRSIYSQTMNVENRDSSSGRSEQAIYGKLVTFGESKNFEGNNNDEKAIFSYTVIGDINDEFGTKDTLSELGILKANVFIKSGSTLGFAGIAEQYFTRWGATIETTDGWNYQDFKGALLVVRHPKSGTVFTYVLKGRTIEINQLMKSAGASLPNPLAEFLPDKDGNTSSGYKFEVADVDFCLDPEGGRKQTTRRDIRIISGARNASGIELVGLDDKTTDKGNRCNQ